FTSSNVSFERILTLSQSGLGPVSFGLDIQSHDDQSRGSSQVEAATPLNSQPVNALLTSSKPGCDTMPFRQTSQEPVMKRTCRLLALIVFSLAHSSVEAQTIARSDQPKPETSAPLSKTDSDSSRTDIQELKAKVDQLLMIVERQQRAMSEMEKRLNRVETGPSKASPAPASNRLGETAVKRADMSAPNSSATAASS